MSIINIALSGMNANKVALDVTSQNVANMNTPGYSRQQVNTTAVNYGQNARTSAGNGVEVTGIRRVTDQFIVKQTWLTGSQEAFSENFSSNMGELETLLNSDSFSISAGLDDFYAALNDASVQPDSTPLRQQIINEADALTHRFNTLSESLLSQHRNLHEQLNHSVANMNGLLTNIASVNNKLIEMRNSDSNTAPLEDEREHLIEQLSSLTDIRTSEQSDGSLQVTLASGQPLVLGEQAAQLVAVPNHDDPYQSELHVEFSGQHFAITGHVGGSIGAIGQYQSDILVPAYHALDDMAEKFADSVNTILTSGKDLKGESGQTLFTYNTANPAASLDIHEIHANELGFSEDGTPGNNQVLQKLIDQSNATFTISGYGDMSIHNAFSSLISQTAIRARQANSDFDAATQLHHQAVSSRNSLSAVNQDEEAANLMTYSNAYQANMKVISTANELFDTVLQLF